MIMRIFVVIYGSIGSGVDRASVIDTRTHQSTLSKKPDSFTRMTRFKKKGSGTFKKGFNIVIDEV